MEQVTGGSVGLRIPVGATKNQTPGFKGITGSVQGGSGGTQFNASGSLGSGTVSGQGDKINKGISASISNTQSGSVDKNWKGVPYRNTNADTSTSTIRTGTMGTFNANVSGGSALKPVTKPTSTTTLKSSSLKPPVEKLSTTPLKPNAVATSALQDKLASRQQAAQQSTVYSNARARLEKGGYTDASGNAYPGSQKYASDNSGDNPNPAIRSQNAQALQDLKLVGDANRAAREVRSTGVKPVARRPDGSYGVQ